MGFNYRKLGDFIQEVDSRNVNGIVNKIFGLTVEKKFERTKSTPSLEDIKKYKIVEPNQLAYSSLNVGRDGMAVALSFFDENISISPVYISFKVVDTSKLNPYYLFLFLRKKEFDRYARYHAFGSIRETFDWQKLCNFKIPTLPLQKQNQIIEELGRFDDQIQIRKKFQKDLKKLIVFYKRFFHDSEKEEPLRKKVKLVLRKNKDNKVKNAVGISWRKTICEYGAIIREEDYSRLQIIQKDDFAWCKEVKGICSISCWTSEKEVLVSGSYQAFRIIDKELLSVGYLMACFFDPHFDRYATYHSFGVSRDQFKAPHLLDFKVSFIDPEIQGLFSYLYELFLINEKIIELCEKRREIVLENFEYLLED